MVLVNIKQRIKKKLRKNSVRRNWRIMAIWVLHKVRRKFMALPSQWHDLQEMPAFISSTIVFCKYIAYCRNCNAKIWDKLGLILRFTLIQYEEVW